MVTSAAPQGPQGPRFFLSFCCAILITFGWLPGWPSRMQQLQISHPYHPEQKNTSFFLVGTILRARNISQNPSSPSLISPYVGQNWLTSPAPIIGTGSEHAPISQNNQN